MEQICYIIADKLADQLNQIYRIIFIRMNDSKYQSTRLFKVLKGCLYECILNVLLDYVS